MSFSFAFIGVHLRTDLLCRYSDSTTLGSALMALVMRVR